MISFFWQAQCGFFKFSLCFFVFFSPYYLSAQQQKIRFKKSEAFVYFFQKDNKSDTIEKGKNDLFYLIVPDSLKERLSIYVDNGQLLATFNDSIVRLNRMSGLKYESIYIQENSKDLNGDQALKKYTFTTLIDGTAVKAGSKLRLRFVDRKRNALMLEQFFWFEE
jgi:hypothetical protein